MNDEQKTRDGRLPFIVLSSSFIVYPRLHPALRHVGVGRPEQAVQEQFAERVNLEIRVVMALGEGEPTVPVRPLDGEGDDRLAGRRVDLRRVEREQRDELVV